MGLFFHFEGRHLVSALNSSLGCHWQIIETVVLAPGLIVELLVKSQEVVGFLLIERKNIPVQVLIELSELGLKVLTILPLSLVSGS